MNKVAKILVQLLSYAAFAAIVGFFSVAPDYQYSRPESAVIKLSLSHAANRVEPCVLLTPQEVAELAPNMRRTHSCERQRLPLAIQLEVDGNRIVNLQAQPSGLWGDGPASVYERFDLEPGAHTITARLRDTDRAEGWDFESSEDVVVEAGRYLTVTFRAESGGFGFR